MINARQLYRTALASSLLGLLTACGGGSDGDPVPVTTAATDTVKQAAFAADLTGGLSALGTYGGLTSASFVDLFDDAFLDAGYTKSEVRGNLAQEATAVTIAPDLSSFPMAMLSAVSISDCSASGICTLTGTLTNSDADTTAVTFTTQVKYVNGKFTLYGDQKSA